MPDIDDDSLDLLPGIVKGLHAYIEELDNDLDNAVARIAALEAGPSSAHNKHQPWFVTATDAEWAELAAWVDWLNENYELTSSNRIVPCWPAHIGARAMACLARGTGSPGSRYWGTHDRLA